MRLAPLSTLLRATLLAAAGLLASPASASDGTLEINQACAAKGCFPGDAPGLPVTVTPSAPASSFRLTSDLVVPDVATSGITVNREGARIDLGGFAIRGPVTCSGIPTVCSGAGQGTGVRLDVTGVEVFGGSVVGMGLNGVGAFEAATIHDVRTAQNGERGIDLGARSIARDCVAERNGAFGIVAGDGSIVDASVVTRNAFHGIVAGSGVIVSGSTASNNGLDGIRVTGGGSVATGSTAVLNAGDGIKLLSGSRATGSLAWLNTGDGIDAGTGSYVSENTLRDNDGAGIQASGTAAYKDNAITSNTAGTVLGGGIDLGGNLCIDNSSIVVPCP